ncbi:MAG: hypothetical protein WCN92_13815, partial [Eubacteriales bacterium]
MFNSAFIKKITAVITSIVMMISSALGLVKPVTPPTTPVLVQDAWFYVSPNGSDSNDGSLASPFATIEKARNAVLILKNGAGLPNGGLTVAIMAGEYRTPNGIGFVAENSGTAACPITYCAYGDGKVILNGGVTLRAEGFKPVSGTAKSRLTKTAAKNVLEF